MRCKGPVTYSSGFSTKNSTTFGCDVDQPFAGALAGGEGAFGAAVCAVMRGEEVQTRHMTFHFMLTFPWHRARVVRRASLSGFAPHSSWFTARRGRGAVFSASLDALQLHLPGGQFAVIEEQHGAGSIAIFVDERQMLRALIGAVGGMKDRQY